MAVDGMLLWSRMRVELLDIRHWGIRVELARKGICPRSRQVAVRAPSLRRRTPRARDFGVPTR
jgi:hypothetical protein